MGRMFDTPDLLYSRLCSMFSANHPSPVTSYHDNATIHIDVAQKKTYRIGHAIVRALARGAHILQWEKLKGTRTSVTT